MELIGVVLGISVKEIFGVVGQPMRSKIAGDTEYRGVSLGPPPNAIGCLQNEDRLSRATKYFSGRETCRSRSYNDDVVIRGLICFGNMRRSQ